MRRSPRELSIDRFIFKNNLIMLFSCFTFIPKTGMGLEHELCFTVKVK